MFTHGASSAAIVCLFVLLCSFKAQVTFGLCEIYAAGTPTINGLPGCPCGQMYVKAGTFSACPSDWNGNAGCYDVANSPPYGTAYWNCNTQPRCCCLSGPCCANGLQKPAGSICKAPQTNCENNWLCDANKNCIKKVKPAGTACGSAVGLCDTTWTCNSLGTCLQRFKPAGTVCRTSRGPCENDMTCSGSSATCPTTSNSMQPATTVCYAQPADPTCELERKCTGSSAACPSTPNYKPANTICKAPDGDCDLASKCTGTSTVCSPSFKNSSTLCYAAQAPCEEPRYCTGSTISCPTQTIISPDGQFCGTKQYCPNQNLTCFGTSTECPFQACNCTEGTFGDDCTCRNTSPQGFSNPLCLKGVWYSTNGTTVLNSSTTVIDEWNINGDLYLASGATLSLSPGSVISVSGCLTLDGDAKVDLANSPIVNGEETSVKVKTNCTSGATDTFNGVSYENFTPPECQIVTNEQIADANGVTIIFRLSEDPNCKERTIIGATVGVVGAVAAAGVGVSFFIFMKRKRRVKKDMARLDGVNERVTEDANYDGVASVGFSGPTVENPSDLPTPVWTPPRKPSKAPPVHPTNRPLPQAPGEGHRPRKPSKAPPVHPTNRPLPQTPGEGHRPRKPSKAPPVHPTKRPLPQAPGEGHRPRKPSKAPPVHPTNRPLPMTPPSANGNRPRKPSKAPPVHPTHKPLPPAPMAEVDSGNEPSSPTRKRGKSVLKERALPTPPGQSSAQRAMPSSPPRPSAAPPAAPADSTSPTRKRGKSVLKERALPSPPGQASQPLSDASAPGTNTDSTSPGRKRGKSILKGRALPTPPGQSTVANLTPDSTSPGRKRGKSVLKERALPSPPGQPQSQGPK